MKNLKKATSAILSNTSGSFLMRNIARNEYIIIIVLKALLYATNIRSITIRIRYSTVVFLFHFIKICFDF